MYDNVKLVEKWRHIWYQSPVIKVLGKIGLSGFYEKLLFQRGVDDLLHLSCQIIISCNQQQMVVAMAIADGFGGCYFTDHF